MFNRLPLEAINRVQSLIKFDNTYGLSILSDLWQLKLQPWESFEMVGTFCRVTQYRLELESGKAIPRFLESNEKIVEP